jgi:hypothetical protein
MSISVRSMFASYHLQSSGVLRQKDCVVLTTNATPMISNQVAMHISAHRTSQITNWEVSRVNNLGLSNVRTVIKTTVMQNAPMMTAWSRHMYTTYVRRRWYVSCCMDSMVLPILGARFKKRSRSGDFVVRGG